MHQTQYPKIKPKSDPNAPNKPQACPSLFYIDKSRDSLVLSRAGLGEVEDDAAAGEALVNLRVGVESVVNTAALLLVKDDLEGLGAVLLGAETLADDLDGVDEVSQDSIVYSGESARAGALLGLEVAGAGRALGAGKDAARSEDEDVAVRELLLELTSQAGNVVSDCCFWTGKKRVTYRCWTRWKPWREGTGTKMTIAFLPWPTSICDRPYVSVRAPG